MDTFYHFVYFWRWSVFGFLVVIGCLIKSISFDGDSVTVRQLYLRMAPELKDLFDEDEVVADS